MDQTNTSMISWSSVIAGALVATGVSFVLLTFGSAIGLASASTAPTWRDASAALWILSGIYLVLVAIVSFGLGGYMTGRLSPLGPSAEDPTDDLRSGFHGLTMWGLAIALGAMLASTAVHQDTARFAPSADRNGLLSYELDQLFRGHRAADADLDTARREADRILLMSSSHSGVSSEDRTYLARLVAARTGISGAEAERRVAAAVTRSHDTIQRARHSAVITAFMIAASLLVGAAIAWFATHEGALHRLGHPRFIWPLPSRAQPGNFP